MIETWHGLYILQSTKQFDHSGLIGKGQVVDCLRIEDQIKLLGHL